MRSMFCPLQVLRKSENMYERVLRYSKAAAMFSIMFIISRLACLLKI